MDLNNENKHQRLTPQTRKETKELNINFGNDLTITFGDKTSLILGPEAYIQVGDITVPGGQTIDINNPPSMTGVTNEVITWVSFEFTDLNEPVYPFLEKAFNGCEKIVSELTNK